MMQNHLAVSLDWGPFGGCRYNKSRSIWGFYLRVPDFWKLPLLQPELYTLCLQKE